LSGIGPIPKDVCIVEGYVGSAEVTEGYYQAFSLDAMERWIAAHADQAATIGYWRLCCAIAPPYPVRLGYYKLRGGDLDDRGRDDFITIQNTGNYLTVTASTMRDLVHAFGVALESSR